MPYYTKDLERVHNFDNHMSEHMSYVISHKQVLETAAQGMFTSAITWTAPEATSQQNRTRHASCAGGGLICWRFRVRRLGQKPDQKSSRPERGHQLWFLRCVVCFSVHLVFLVFPQSVAEGFPFKGLGVRGWGEIVCEARASAEALGFGRRF